MEEGGNKRQQQEEEEEEEGTTTTRIGENSELFRFFFYKTLPRIRENSEFFSFSLRLNKHFSKTRENGKPFNYSKNEFKTINYLSRCEGSSTIENVAEVRLGAGETGERRKKKKR